MDQLLNVQNPTTQQQIEFCRTLRTETVRIIKTSEMVEMLRAIEMNLISVQRWEQSLAEAAKHAEKAATIYPNAGKLNVYTCDQHRHATITIDREEGVTSFIISCPICKSDGLGDVEAYSAMYQVSSVLKPTHEWYKPTEDDLRNLKAIVDPNHFNNLMTHVEQGGLLFRKIEEVCNG